ncbi:MAG: hypothetical protein JW795_15765 [Chitinivibrionales bacterium]|nr:hypothetical protein [Chitinivibrionales bacterium]
MQNHRVQKDVWLHRGFILCGLCATLLISCASQYHLLASASTARTGTLKNMVNASALQSPLIVQADSLYTASLLLIKKGDEEHGYLLMDLAFAYYRLILTRKQALETMTLIQELEQRLTDTKEELTSFQKLLASLYVKPQQ